MYKITRNGKTIVGNNEDWQNPNTQIWFEPRKANEYGIMNVGFIDGFAQGAINEAGLMFDGFAMPYLAVNNSEGKTTIPIGQAIKKIMHSYASIKEVKNYLSTIDLSGFTNSMVVFVDKTGEYLIVEGDELIIGNEAEQIFSNFYPSQTKSKTAVQLPFYQNGLKFVNNSTPKFSAEYCSSVMEHLSQAAIPQFSSFSTTQYSTIYDLEKLTIRVYHFNNFDNFIEINLKKELKKGAHQLLLPELFPKNTKGYQTYLKYNDANNPISYLKEVWEKDSQKKKGKALKEYKKGFAAFLNTVGYEWLHDKKDTKSAIAIFTYGTELIPSNANLYDSLGEAFYKNKEYEAAVKNYKKSLELNPDNNNAIKMLQTIKTKKSNK